MTVQGALGRLWVPACFCLLAVIVFATQFAGTGFGVEGQHYAWVSSHNLAIASRATPENGFVGHARGFLDADGTPDHVYFDRYPPFFSAMPGALTSLTDDLATKVWIARQLMHVMFVLTMLFAWLLLRRLGLALPDADGRDDLRLLYTGTPENQVGFLFDLRSGERYAPGNVAPRFNFGNALALGHRELWDSVEARPCQGIRVESWWQAQVPLSASYHLQLSLVDEDGGVLASADSAPVGGDTQDWLPGRWYPDGRTLHIPCEAATGALSLILSVYDPETNALNDKLPLMNADGSAGDTWLYLTTVNVN